MYALIPHGAEVNTALAARLGILAAFALAAAVLAALLVFRRQADDRALLAAAVVLAIGVPFLLPHMHERYFFLADVLALAWTCAFPRSAPCALLVELASLGAYGIAWGNLPVSWMAACSLCCERPGLWPGLCSPRPPARLPSKIQRVTACPLPSGMPVQISCEISRKAVDELETMCYNLVTVFKNSYNSQRRSKWQLRIFP